MSTYYGYMMGLATGQDEATLQQRRRNAEDEAAVTFWATALNCRRARSFQVAQKTTQPMLVSVRPRR